MFCTFEKRCGMEGKCHESKLIIEILRDDKGKAYNQGFVRTGLQEINGKDALTFLGIQKNGSVHVTTVYTDGSAVHSRHTFACIGLG